MDKRQRQFDKAVEEWKRRVAEQQSETERWQKECRNQAAESYKLKAQLDEAQQAVETIRKDNKNLNGSRTFCHKFIIPSTLSHDISLVAISIDHKLMNVRCLL